MADYAIGDVQGCFDELRRLLDVIAFDPAADRLHFVGDLVNRGPHSLQTLRFIQQLGDAAVAVLGNHDLHLLAVAYGVRPTKHRDTFDDVLGADDRDELLDWLRSRPLLHSACGFYLIHAGLPPQWTLSQAIDCAQEIETVLRGQQSAEFFRQMYGDQPRQWAEDLQGWARLRFICNCFTRLRYCDAHGVLDMQEMRTPGMQATPLLPWFRVPNRASAGAQIVFGHWSTLGFHAENGCICLDTGCLWGGELTALRLDDGHRFSVAGPPGGYQQPGD